jgi:hypothetical protein
MTQSGDRIALDFLDSSMSPRRPSLPECPDCRVRGIDFDRRPLGIVGSSGLSLRRLITAATGGIERYGIS